MVRHDAGLTSTEGGRGGRVPDFQGGFSTPCGGGLESESQSRLWKECPGGGRPASVALLVQPRPGELSSVPVLQR